MTQIHISNSDHTVTVHHDSGDLSYVIEKAQKLWDETKPDRPTVGPGSVFGFHHERRPTDSSFNYELGKGGPDAPPS